MTKKKTSLVKNFSVVLALVFLFGCNSSTSKHWSEVIPDSTPFLIVPQENSSIDDFLSAAYAPLFDDITPSAIQLISEFENFTDNPIAIEAILLYPDVANEWQPVWVTQSSQSFLRLLKREYQREFAQNNYTFQSHTIEKLYISDREFYVVDLSGWLFISESSLSLESILRVSSGHNSAMPLSPEQIEPGRFIINTSSLNRWVQQVAQVMYRPGLLNMLDGGEPVSLKLNRLEDSDWSWQLLGNMKFGENRSTLMQSISSDAVEFTLDRYISINTSGFSIMRLEPRMVPPDGLTVRNSTDQFIKENPDIWSGIASALDSEFAFATFAESGAASTSEYLYLRKLTDAGEVRSQLNRLVSEDLAVRDGNNYYLNSPWLAKLFGSEINPMIDFNISIFRDVAAIAIRKGLAESVASDANRRRVVYYDDNYSEIRGSLPDRLSSFTLIDASTFGIYIQPWLYPQNYMSTLLAGLDQLVITTRRTADSELELAITSFESEQVDLPFRENWIFPIGGANITGQPVLVDVTGSNRNEIVFSTENGSVHVLAADGTSVLQTSTGADRPVGPPVVYDWYGNNQNVIMQAAGNKIYAWNNSGTTLPNFPIILSESITTPLTIMDIIRNGVAEIIVGTSDRQLHVLNTRGQHINGWPQSTNAIITTKPLIATIDEQQSIFVNTENTLHAWDINGNSRNGFPVFLPAQIAGSPAKYDNHILGSGLDGSLYSIGLNSLFSDTLSSTHSSDSLFVQSIQISNSSLNVTPSSESILMRDDEGFFRENLIITQSSNGSVFMYNRSGVLRFTRSMGQPSSPSYTPTVLDLDRNSRSDIVALADFGRIYAWDILSGDRLYDLPTTGMNHIIISDITRNGNLEIIAQTRDGIRSWTILRTRRDSN